MQTISDLSPEHGVRPLCRALDVAPATYYRQRKSPLQARDVRDAPEAPPSGKAAGKPANAEVTASRRVSPRALSTLERKRVLDMLHEPRFVDLAPAQVYATLLDEGTYLCSERIMYRLLAVEGEVRERRA